MPSLVLDFTEKGKRDHDREEGRTSGSKVVLVFVLFTRLGHSVMSGGRRIIQIFHPGPSDFFWEVSRLHPKWSRCQRPRGVPVDRLEVVPRRR